MEEKNLEKDAIRVQLKWGAMEIAPTFYANQLLITHTGGEFYLVFGELSPLAVLDKDNPPSHLDIKPIVKIAITPANMIKFSEVIQENVSNFEKTIMRGKGDEDL